MPNPPKLSQKDGTQVLRAVMDDVNNRLRVDAVISPDGHDLEIHYADDSIAIGDPTSDNILSINNDGSANVLNIGQLVPKAFDDIGITNITIAGTVVPSVIIYRMGGPSGTVVARLTLTYDLAANLTHVTRT